jgi:hypothetical protein
VLRSCTIHTAAQHGGSGTEQSYPEPAWCCLQHHEQQLPGFTQADAPSFLVHTILHVMQWTENRPEENIMLNP